MTDHKLAALTMTVFVAIAALTGGATLAVFTDEEGIPVQFNASVAGNTGSGQIAGTTDATTTANDTTASETTEDTTDEPTTDTTTDEPTTDTTTEATTTQEPTTTTTSTTSVRTTTTTAGNTQTSESAAVLFAPAAIELRAKTRSVDAAEIDREDDSSVGSDAEGTP